MSLATHIILQGIRADQPAAASVTPGALYGVTDEGDIIERSNGATWEAYSPTGSASGTVTHTGALTSSAVVVGNGTDDIKVLASLGTTTTVLHGNAAGLPTYGAVVEADITLADNTTNNASTSKHGLLKKLSNVGTEYMDGTGGWSVPAGGGGGSSVTQGTYASLPGTCAVGDMYLFTDTVYQYAQCATTNVWTLFQDGKIIVPPGPKASWTNVNAGSDLVVTDAAGAIQLQITVGGGTQFRGISIAQPSTPYSKVFRIKATSAGTNSCIWGTYFYDGTKFMGVEWVPATGVNIMRVLRWTNVTTPSTNLTTRTVVSGSPYDNGGWVRLSNDAATLSWDFSIDGRTWMSLGTEAVGTTLTPTHLLVGGLVGEASAINYLSFQGYT